MCFIFSFKYPANTALLYRSVYSSGIVRAPERERERDKKLNKFWEKFPKLKMVLEKKLPESKKLLKNFVMGQNLQRNVTILNIIWWDSLHAVF